MNQGFTSVPFKTDTASGFSTAAGVAKFSGAGLILEFESKFMGLIGGGIQEARVSIADILDVKFKKGIFKVGAKIIIRPRSMAAFAHLPHSEGKLVLKLAKEDFERGQEAAEQMQKDLGRFQAESPPPHTPVSQLFRDESEDDTKELDQ